MSETMAAEESTRQLVERASSGDRSAFDDLVRRHRLRLSRQIESRMGEGVRTKLTADDVLQETLAVAFQSIGRFSWQGEGSFYSWLGGIAEHVIANAARKKAWNHLEIKRDFSGRDPTPSKNLRRNERFDRLQDALNRLGPDHRKAILLSRVDGLKVHEIAKRMNRSPNAVYKLLARALLEMRQDFGDTESLSLPERTFESEETNSDD